MPITGQHSFWFKCEEVRCLLEDLPVMNSLEKNYRGLLGWMMQAQGSGLRTLIAAGAWFHLRNYLLNSFHATVLFLYPLKCVLPSTLVILKDDLRNLALTKSVNLVELQWIVMQRCQRQLTVPSRKGFMPYIYGRKIFHILFNPNNTGFLEHSTFWGRVNFTRFIFLIY